MIGQTVSHYRVLEPLGEGGMGSVYVAEDLHLGRRVAIKFPNNIGGDEHHFRARFLREARSVSKLSHPHIATVYDYGESADGHPFLVMELITGPSLGELIHNGEVTLLRALEIVKDIAEALGEAHKHGIIHRDVKPNNVLINEHGQVKVLDFGLAKQITDEPSHLADPDARTLLATHTRTGAVVGTPLYLSPEQATSAPVDARSDLFALGALLYECITGRPAFPGTSVIEIVAQVIHVDPPAPSSINRRVPQELDRITLKALAKKPSERYQSAEEFLDDLGRVYPSLSDDAHLTQRLYTTRKTANSSALTTLNNILQRPRLSIARLLLGALALALALGFVWWMWLRAVAHQPPAEAVRWYETGTGFLRDGAYFQASKALERAVSVDEKYALAHARLAEALTELDYGDRAKDELLRVSALTSVRSTLTKLDALYIDAITATTTRDFPAAIRAYQEIARLTPNLPQVYVDLGRAYENNEETKKAVESYLKATELDNQYATAYLRVGILYGRQQELASAKAAFARAEDIYRVLGNVEGRSEVFFQRGSLALRRVEMAEAREQLQQALELARVTNNLPLQIKTMLQLSYVFQSAGDSPQAERLASDAVALAQANGMENLSVRGLVDLGSVYLARGDSTRGDYEVADKYFSQALEGARRYKARRNEARALFSLGSLRIQQSRPDEAVNYLEPALNFYQQSGYLKEASQALILLARVRRQKGDYDGALALFQQQQQLAERIGDQSQKALALEGIGNVLLRQERYPEALDSFNQSYTIYKTLGNQRGIGNSLTNQSFILAQLGRAPEARSKLDEILSLVKQSEDNNASLQIRIHLHTAMMMLSEQRFVETRAEAKEALALAGTKDKIANVQAKELLGQAELYSGSKPEGKRLAAEAYELAKGINEPYMLSTAQLVVAEALFETGDLEGAKQSAQMVAESATRLGQLESAWRAWLLLARAVRRAGDPGRALEYGARSGTLLANLERRLGEDNYRSYLARRDIQFLRKQLDEESAKSS